HGPEGLRRARREGLALRVAPALAVALALVAGCVAEETAEEAPAAAPGSRFVVDFATDEAEAQEAVLAAFARSATEGATKPLVLVDRTVEGEKVVYTVEPAIATPRGRAVRFVLDASDGTAAGAASPR